ncbi:hypothetical protein ACFLRF_03490 [Candidatus Altiarchaeota archaeon]
MNCGANKKNIDKILNFPISNKLLFISMIIFFSSGCVLADDVSITVTDLENEYLREECEDYIFLELSVRNKLDYDINCIIDSNKGDVGISDSFPHSQNLADNLYVRKKIN